MDYSELFAALEELERERGIPKDYMLTKIEAGLLAALKKDAASAETLAVLVDEDAGTIRLVTRRRVVEEIEIPGAELTLEEAKAIDPRYGLGDIVEEELDPHNFGRISAQNAKQVIIQGIREFERDKIYNEYHSREHELLSCVVARIDRRGAALTLDKTEVFLVTGEQIPGEVLREGRRIKVYVVEVRNSTRGPQIMISRTHPGMVRRLFEMEVPEIASGEVEIKSVAREAGARSKMAVHATVDGVDPIGACIGPKGSRVAAVVNELHGEKIDIIRWHEKPEDFIAEALAPAEVREVMLGRDHGCRAIVPDDQLSLAIGKEGQNARLAAKLTGWKIDIKPLSERDIWYQRTLEDREAEAAEIAEREAREAELAALAALEDEEDDWDDFDEELEDELEDGEVEDLEDEAEEDEAEADEDEADDEVDDEDDD
ncbi:MAG: transcription termination/antitermination protein NusA, partial [Clostridia bacterium]|nr:transcription termination/antitermination protein NusA [Clostridia bacterium]